MGCIDRRRRAPPRRARWRRAPTASTCCAARPGAADAVKFVPTALPGVLVVEPDVFRDARGFFLETYHAGKYARRRHRRDLRAGQPLAVGARHPARPARAAPAPAGQAGARACAARSSTSPWTSAAARRTFGRWVGVALSADELPPALRPARLRARLLRAQRDGRGRVQVHRLLRPDRRDRASSGTTRSSGSRWPIAEPVLSDKDRAGQALAALWDQLPVYEASR